MKVSIIILMVLVTWVVAMPSDKWGDGGKGTKGNGLGLITGLGALLQQVLKSLSGLLGGLNIGVLLDILPKHPGNSQLNHMLQENNGDWNAVVETDEGKKVLMESIVKLIASKGGDTNTINSILGILGKDKGALNAIEKKILLLVKDLLKGGGRDLLTEIKRLIWKLGKGQTECSSEESGGSSSDSSESEGSNSSSEESGGSSSGESGGSSWGKSKEHGGIIDIKLKIKLLRIIKAKILAKIGGSKGGSKEVIRKELEKIKKTIIKKIEKEVLRKRKSGGEWQESEMLSMCERLTEKELESYDSSLNKIRGGKKGSSSSQTIDVSVRKEITKITEERLVEELKQTGVIEEHEELTSQKLTKCKEVILKKVEEEVREKQRSGTKLRKSEIIRITEEVVKREAQSETIIKIVKGGKKGNSSSSETISVSTKEEISKVTEERLVEELKQTGVIEEHEELTSQKLTKCKEVILKKVEEEVREKQRSGSKLEKHEIIRITEEVVKREAQSETILKIVRGGKKGSSSSSETISVSTKEEISKVTEERLVEELKQTGVIEEHEELTSQKLTKCKEVILKKVEEEVREKQRSGTKLEKHEIIRITEEVVKREAQSETILKIVRGGKKGSSSSSETISVTTKEEITKVTEEKLTEVLKEKGVLKEGRETLTSEELTQCKEVILKKVEEEVREKQKSGSKLEKHEIIRITEEVVKKEAQSETILKIVGGWNGGSSSSETISVAAKEEITKVTEERLTEVLKETGVLKEGRETLTSEELTQCKEVILKKVEEEVREKRKRGSKVDKSEIIRITEEVVKREAKSETILKIVGGWNGGSSSSETISVATKEEITKVTEERLTEVLKESGVLKEGKEKLTSEELTQCKEVILKKVEEEVREKQKSGSKLEKHEIIRITEEVVKREAKSETILKIVGGWNGGSSSSETISVAAKEEITKVTEERLTEVLKESGVLKEGKEKLTSEELTQCKEVILKKVEEEVREKQKSGSKLEKHEIIRITEEVVKREAKSETILKIVGGWNGGSSSSETISVATKEEITKVTEERLTEVLKESGVLKEGKEKLTSEELTQCKEVILKKVEEEVREKQKSGSKLEKHEIIRITEEVVKREAKSETILKIVGGWNGGSSSSETISVSAKEEITKVTEEKLTEVLKQSGVLKEGKEELTSEELTQCKEVILKRVEEEVREKQKSGSKLEESEIRQLTEEVIKKEAKSERILNIVGGKVSSEEVIDVGLWEKITEVTKETLQSEVKKAKSSGKIEEELSLTELQKCRQRILKQVKQELHEVKKSGKKLEESKVLSKVEEIVQKQVHESNLLVEVRNETKAEKSES